MVEIRRVCKSFEGKSVLKDVSFVFPSGAVSAITGVSGCGKTTLARVILGVEKPDSGEVILSDSPNAACVFQEDRLIEHMSALDNVKLVSRAGDAAKALEELGLDASSKDRVSTYSGGMRRRVAIARAVMSNPDLIVLDEPFKGLDEAARKNAADYIANKCPGACVILITHDPDELALMGAENILVLQPQAAQVVDAQLGGLDGRAPD